MPEKSPNQSQTIDELILSILSDEAQMAQCLREFFCKILQEISTIDNLPQNRKILLIKNLINTATQKELALAAVLEAIGKVIGKEPSVNWIILLPGAFYQIISSSLTMQTILFVAKTDPGISGGKITAFHMEADELFGIINISNTPKNYTMDLGDVFFTNTITLKNTGTVPIYIRNVTAS